MAHGPLVISSKLDIIMIFMKIRRWSLLYSKAHRTSNYIQRPTEQEKPTLVIERSRHNGVPFDAAMFCKCFELMPSTIQPGIENLLFLILERKVVIGES